VKTFPEQDDLKHFADINTGILIKISGWDGHLTNHLPELQTNRQVLVFSKN